MSGHCNGNGCGNERENERDNERDNEHEHELDLSFQRFVDLAHRRNLMYFNFIQQAIGNLQDGIRHDIEELEAFPECIAREFPEAI